MIYNISYIVWIIDYDMALVSHHIVLVMMSLVVVQVLVQVAVQVAVQVVVQVVVRYLGHGPGPSSVGHYAFW